VEFLFCSVVKILKTLTAEFLMLLKVKISAVGNAFQFAPASAGGRSACGGKRKAVFNISAGLGIMSQLIFGVRTFPDIFLIYT